MGTSRNPPWQRDELILALDLYFDLPDGASADNDPRVHSLSWLLNELPIHEVRDDKFRNVNSVSMKLRNFAFLDPRYRRKGRRGLEGTGAKDREVWFEFSGDRERLKRIADTIRFIYDKVEAATGADDLDEVEFPEGRIMYRLHRSRERNRTLIEKAKLRQFRLTGHVACQVCSFEFGAFYGELGDGFIEAHHTVALSQSDYARTTKVSELALVCANCHRMLHRRRPWLTVTELANLTREA